MNPRARAITGVVIMSALLALYFVAVGVRSLGLFATGSLIAIMMGAALTVLPIVGAWALIRELRFGAQSTRLVDRLAAEGLLPDELGEVGLIKNAARAAADASFSRYQAEAEHTPAHWQSWARLSLVYDACGDRARARLAMRHAIARSRPGATDQNSAK